MATYFGEVLGINSRAVNEEEMEAIQSYDLIFDSVQDRITNVKCNVGIFAFGKTAMAFVHSYFVSDLSKLLATVKITPSIKRDTMQYSNVISQEEPKKVASLYVTPDNYLICEVEDNFPEDLSFELSSKAVKFCSDSSIAVILMSNHISAYKTTDDNINEESFLRCLATTACFQKYSVLGCPYLKPPNIIGNFPAAVLSEFEISKRVAILFICYSESFALNIENVTVFKQLLHIPLLEKLSKNTDSDDKLKNFLMANYKEPDNLFT